MQVRKCVIIFQVSRNETVLSFILCQRKSSMDGHEGELTFSFVFDEPSL